MDHERVFTWPLVLFLLVVTAILGWALVLHLGPWSFAATVEQLRVGDLEGAERRRLLRRVLAAGVTAAAAPVTPEAAFRVACGAMAAVALDDAVALALPGFRRLVGQARTPPQLSVADAAAVAFVDPALQQLGAALASEAAGDQAAARQGYQQAAASSVLFHLVLAGQLAQEGLARLP